MRLEQLQLNVAEVSFKNIFQLLPYQMTKKIIDKTIVAISGVLNKLAEYRDSHEYDSDVD